MRSSLTGPGLRALLACLAAGLWATGARAAKDWELIDTGDRVKVFRRSVPGSDFVAFRGEGIVDAPISKVIRVAFTPTRFPEWTDMLVDVAPVIEQGFRLVVWEHYDNPWPVQDRDFLYGSNAEVDGAQHAFTLHFRSLERRDVPAQECCIRGEILDTFFRFKALPDHTTFIECEVLLDPKGWLPAWLVNIVQRDWPMNTLSAFRKQVQKPDIAPYPGFEDW